MRQTKDMGQPAQLPEVVESRGDGQAVCFCCGMLLATAVAILVVCFVFWPQLTAVIERCN